jgi:hypothetical protein
MGGQAYGQPENRLRVESGTRATRAPSFTDVLRDCGVGPETASSNDPSAAEQRAAAPVRDDFAASRGPQDRHQLKGELGEDLG